MLLWNKEADWSVKQVLAVNLILLYFSSVGMGSAIGWCSNTPYHHKVSHTCIPKMHMSLSLKMIPLMNHSSFMADECPEAPKRIVNKAPLLLQSLFNNII